MTRWTLCRRAPPASTEPLALPAGSCTKPSAIAEASRCGEVAAAAEAQEARHPVGWYLALARYSDSSCHHREPITRKRRHSRSTGPAPIRSPCSNAARNIAKFSESRSTPSVRARSIERGDHELGDPVVHRAVAAHQVEREPVGAPRDERQQRRAARRPASKHSTSTQLPSAGSPSRPERHREAALGLRVRARRRRCGTTSAISPRE